VLINDEGEPFCGGTLLTKNKVLTGKVGIFLLSSNFEHHTLNFES
jgi:hypothetical protein